MIFDYSQIISHYWWLPMLLMLIGLLKSPWFKGVMGEAMVNLAACLFLDNNDYLLIRNVSGHKHFARKREAPPLNLINL
ncbi:MAG: hypothetical protein CO186_01015 [Zetaproteobacteria bacterium CG_4_9_14_3_um_filter_49_83]|nr:MAG: hypothetical protein AUJ56_02350 [Zetaproteobacteria bacterium CG1_02_49_23]PIQ30041.1 MAG: hypothetical protein COW62_13590 [Zetaproteobacteria bacterium CG17_big_fil_post_rev_8_21_14_2_50_50_13]PIV29217.1 MAG: hypothetical protein COS35_13340 [Zetaproteobacteria bacterium CG02_land_8_20_14_3_00_50_9]PIY56011.1 MAG: hypothetical protein COZ00_06685 [Zetaproteobacteria bacterium CG_4_10_14_0_8_um_filter_49_80]PJA36313.1 MAG: hypothetical protein CO186_01015 [Zetaproteobacteria bacterium